LALLRDSRDDMRALIANAAARLEMPEVFIEKDYWVTELLRSIAAPIDGAFIVFKGGTSLSKAIGAIQRFSEDVDILLVMEASDAGKGAKDRVLKDLSKRAALDLGLEEVRETSGKGVHRTTSYPYEPLNEPGPVRSAVLLEMGTRGGVNPSSARVLTSYVAQAAPETAKGDFEEFAPVTVRVLDPERTLLEKLYLLHSLAVRYPDTSESLLRAGRHLYDVFCLLGREDVIEALRKTDVSRICEEIRQVSITEWGDHTVRPEKGFSYSPAFDPSAPCASLIDEAYELVDGLLLGRKPSLASVREAVRANSTLL
jgi:predicted nucleotidyltransferase component of viral defense system